MSVCNLRRRHLGRSNSLAPHSLAKFVTRTPLGCIALFLSSSMTCYAILQVKGGFLP